MPIVRITGWPRGNAPSAPPASLQDLLAEEAGMDGTEAADAVQRLMKGEFVDAYFDLGEDAAARAFMKQAEQFGLIQYTFATQIPALQHSPRGLAQWTFSALPRQRNVPASPLLASRRRYAKTYCMMYAFAGATVWGQN
jgi:hypothetical protein